MQPTVERPVRSADPTAPSFRPSTNRPGRRLPGVPLELSAFRAETVTNRQFERFDLDAWDRLFLPSAMARLMDEPSLGSWGFVEDDNRGAVDPTPAATLDGVDFYLSVKGVGSSVEPFSTERLDRVRAASVTDRSDVRSRLGPAPPDGGPDAGGVITGELWLRGSPYGGQGLEHARTALAVSEAADLTDLHGFRIAPVVKVALFPPELEDRIRSIRWYRRFPGRMAQEIRLVPSNVRVYFHSRSALGTDVGDVYDRFGLDTPEKAFRFEFNFVRSGVAVLTLFARTLVSEDGGRAVRGLDFHDVWLDKDAVVAPDGTIYFVDLEGIEPVRLPCEEAVGKIEDQIYRSLYEFMFAYEQVEAERSRRFGDLGSRRAHFGSLLTVALRNDPYVRVLEEPSGVLLEVRNPLGDERYYHRFPLVDR